MKTLRQEFPYSVLGKYYLGIEVSVLLGECWRMGKSLVTILSLLALVIFGRCLRVAFVVIPRAIWGCFMERRIVRHVAPGKVEHVDPYCVEYLYPPRV